MVNDQQPYKTLKEFVDDAKKRPERDHLQLVRPLRRAAHPDGAVREGGRRLKLRHLPTNGGGPAMTALLGNNAQVLASSVSAALAQIKAGKLRPLASFGAQRSKALPDVPTMKELGYDLEYYLWVGMFAPKGTPAPIVTTLRAGIDKAAHSEQFNDRADQSRPGARLPGSGRVRQVLGRRRQAHRGSGAPDRRGWRAECATATRDGAPTLICAPTTCRVWPS